MKKMLFMFLCAVTLTCTFLSCSNDDNEIEMPQDYTCTCVAADSAGIITPTSVSVIIENVLSSEAEEQCAANETTVGSVSVTCTLD